MDSKKPIIVKRINQSTEKVQQRSNQSTQKTQRRFQPLPQSTATELVEPREIEQPEQPEPEIQLQSLAEPPIDQSIYGSGWSVAELMNEFSGRYD